MHDWRDQRRFLVAIAQRRPAQARRTCAGPARRTDRRSPVAQCGWGRRGRAVNRHNLRISGISELNVRKWAGSSKGYWRVAGSPILGVALPSTY